MNENATMQTYIDRAEQAQVAYEAAAHRYQTVQAAPGGVVGAEAADAAGQLDAAQADYQQAAHDLSQQVSALWRAGWRLCKPAIDN